MSRRFDAGSAADRIQMRLERVRDQGSAAEDRGRQSREPARADGGRGRRPGRADADEMPDERAPGAPAAGRGRRGLARLSLPSERVRALERELSRLDAQADERRAEESRRARVSSWRRP